MLAGSAGTGKSRACLEFLYACAAQYYPGMRALIVRKTRASLTESALVTWEQKVVPPGSPILHGARRASRQAYHFPNGSTIVVGGLDNPTRTFSTEYDLIYVQEAIELSEDEWEKLLRPLRNGAMPYQELIADTNPDAPSHWLYKRAMAGKVRMLESRHEDNPLLWNHEAQCWREEGQKYIDMLDRLTGPRLQRLRFGRWVQAEGVVYEGYDARLHLIDRFPIPKEWARYWSVDFGFTNPFVFQCWAQDPDGRLYRYREIYRAQKLVEDHARHILELTKDEPKPQAIICDHDAEGRATLERYLGMNTEAARKDITAGIQAVAGRLKVAGDGKPRLFLLRDSQVERCPHCEEKKLPLCLEDELPGYRWNVDAGRKKGEEPIDKDNHGADCARYCISHFDLAPYKTIQAW